MKRNEFFKRAAGAVAGALMTAGAASTAGASACTVEASPAPPLLDAEREAFQKQYADLFFEREFEKARFFRTDEDIERWRQYARWLEDRLKAEEKPPST